MRFKNLYCAKLIIIITTFHGDYNKKQSYTQHAVHYRGAAGTKPGRQTELNPASHETPNRFINLHLPSRTLTTRHAPHTDRLRFDNGLQERSEKMDINLIDKAINNLAKQVAENPVSTTADKISALADLIRARADCREKSYSLSNSEIVE